MALFAPLRLGVKMLGLNYFAFPAFSSTLRAR